MTSQARQALAVIRKCVDDDRFAIGIHSAEHMEERGLFWPDVQAVIDSPMDVRSDDMDRYGRPRWVVCGEAATGDQIEIVCAIEIDETGTEFITLSWED